ncbi:hypothetical protein PybrP1_009391 [[Pythium] brassicae (nom. inval.)]|nr:hypothetical protein PybrP1_009391 [[Pythium] brassicae (nom. inval.)]
MPAMPRSSLLTEGLEPLAQHSREVRALLERLYELDDELQAAHVLAKRDDEFGEEVVTRYKRFLAHREELVAALGTAQAPVPWQLRMRIDDIELTLRQREEKRTGAKSVTPTTTQQESDATKEFTSQAEEASPALPPASPTERRVVTLLVPSLLALVLALLWYQWFF